MFPLGNKACSALPPIPLSNNKNAGDLSYPAGMTRLDLTLKMIDADGSESLEHCTGEIPDRADTLHRVFHVLHTELRVTVGVESNCCSPTFASVQAIRSIGVLNSPLLPVAGGLTKDTPAATRGEEGRILRLHIRLYRGLHPKDA